MKSQSCVLAVLVIGLFYVPLTAQAQTPANDAQDIVFLAKNKPVLIRLHIQIDGKPYRAVWQQFMTKVFKSFDTNRDDILDEKEAGSLPKLFNGNSLRAIYSTNNILKGSPHDANKDGKITPKEFADYYRRNGGAPFQIHYGKASPAQNGVMLLSALNRGNRDDSATELNNSLLKQLDTNGDGKLLQQELAATPKALLKRDTDDDEIVTSQELMGEVRSSTGTSQFVAILDRNIGNTNTALKQASPFVVLDSDASPYYLAKKILKRYGANSILQPKDTNLPDKDFKRLDADKNGQLDAAELSHFAKRPPDIEFNIRLGKNQEVGMVSLKGARVPKNSKLRKSANGKITFLAGIDQITVQLNSSRVNGRNGMMFIQRNRINNQLYQALFNSADQDNNGYLDKSETQRIAYLGSSQAMDANKDGKIFEKEFFTYMAKAGGLQAKAEAACTTLSISENGRGFFDLLDTNRDGRLSVREMRQAVLQVQKLDGNKDGAISQNEIPQRFGLSLKRGAVASNPLGRQVVAFVQGGRLQAPVKPRPQRGPAWFRKMDRNADGDVSPREFLGSDEVFRLIDRDGDRLISVDEAERAPTK